MTGAAPEFSSDRPTAASYAPLSFSVYRLIVRDLPRMVDFYSQAVGLQVEDRAARTVTLGNDGVALLELVENAAARPDDNRSAGLHHAAFLMPTRADLADWHAYFTQTLGHALSRTGDHHVNEALYFDDPEGNGAECYADRSASHWQWDADGKVYIPSSPVDLDDLAREAHPEAARRDWHAPPGLRLGHINLRVGDLDSADRFYCSILGLDHTCRRPQMTFMSTGRYHHHMAANIFTSAGAGQRDDARAGLGSFTFANSGAFDIDQACSRLTAAGVPFDRIDGGIRTRDPWGTQVNIKAA